MSPILLILIIFAITALVLYIFNTFVPMNQQAKTAINLLIIVAAIAWVVVIAINLH